MGQIALSLATLFLGGVSFADGSQSASPTDQPSITAMVRQVAFDPATYFPSPYIRDQSVVRIAYTGDDYGWPVYSIAIAAGCIHGETNPRDDCGPRLRARMVRAPGFEVATRPRRAGADLISRITDTNAASLEDVREAVSDSGLDWLEADVRACPNALATLARSADAAWVPDAVANPTPEGTLSGLVLHPDIVHVEIKQYARLTTYTGWLAERSPATWAAEMAAVLEPCWRPAPNDPPWLRPAVE